MSKIPYVIDCDTGTDDAIAIICALLAQDRLDIKAFTTVAGNVEVTKTSANTLNIVDQLGFDIPVAKGAAAPLRRELYTAISHGTTGLGNVVLPSSPRGLYDKDGADTLYHFAKECEGELCVLAVGPLTNLALALTRYPEIKHMIKQITIMGGALVGGNMTPTSEFNMWVDPDAAKIVFDSGIPLTMIGLDVTLKCKVPLPVYERICSISNPFAELAARIFRYMLHRNETTGVSLYGTVELNEAFVHDALALAVTVRPDLVKTRKYFMTVETQGDITRGMTVADFNDVMQKEPNVDAAVEVDVEAFWAWMVELLENGPNRVGRER
ncbi:nucleoside hydrolase [Cohnella pontilimi]|uniref:Nucleoside hydrolase n=1 Tax=Cohnella pontilimi TaxID=2564100 RepID=A0A4U0F7M3_9BACL|nr:nucleoside hydrolase [Cohnella pontilimi]TJY40686.1 nucleoside hydrolase [Cohnella pontilimi]